MTLVNDWLKNATKLLQAANVPSARLDAEIILAHSLQKNRTWLHAHGEESIDPRLHDIADARLKLRQNRVSIAYIIGHKEFYGRRFKVTPVTLTPRPESEAMIELLDKLPLSPGQQLVDVGTGTGCLGITAKLEHPELNVTLLDISQKALNVAEENAELHQANIITLKSNLLKQYPFTPNIILANLPYVDKTWHRDPETSHEPGLALFADDNGLALIKDLLVESSHRLAKQGYVLLESDLTQHHFVAAHAENSGFELVQEQGLCQVYQLR